MYWFGWDEWDIINSFSGVFNDTVNFAFFIVIFMIEEGGPGFLYSKEVFNGPQKGWIMKLNSSNWVVIIIQVVACNQVQWMVRLDKNTPEKLDWFGQ